MPGSSKWTLSIRFPHQNTAYISALPHTCYMPRQSHLSMTLLGKYSRLVSLNKSLTDIPKKIAFSSYTYF
jgi:hypothetical protein